MSQWLLGKGEAQAARDKLLGEMGSNLNRDVAQLDAALTLLQQGRYETVEEVAQAVRDVAARCRDVLHLVSQVQAVGAAATQFHAAAASVQSQGAAYKVMEDEGARPRHRGGGTRGRGVRRGARGTMITPDTAGGRATAGGAGVADVAGGVAGGSDAPAVAIRGMIKGGRLQGRGGRSGVSVAVPGLPLVSEYGGSVAGPSFAGSVAGADNSAGTPGRRAGSFIITPQPRRAGDSRGLERRSRGDSGLDDDTQRRLMDVLAVEAGD